MSNYFKVQSKKVYAQMQEVEDEKYRERVTKKKELDALDAEYVVDSIKHAGALAIAVLLRNGALIIDVQIQSCE